MLIFLDYDYLRKQSIFFASWKIIPLYNFTALNVPEDQWICHRLKAIKFWHDQLLYHSGSPELSSMNMSHSAFTQFDKV